jgi:hypothetical protein
MQRTSCPHGVNEEEGGANELNDDARSAETLNGLPLVVQPGLWEISGRNSVELAQFYLIAFENRWERHGSCRGAAAPHGRRQLAFDTRE